ncbi:ComEC/Rec2 family competence protein [Marinicrinis sediminis]|uniref:ComEC/Rec2 family competence protein n=1 Tax=Marinicrinis sediminis TaxID=1652465 RepID=A0ABW5REV8_9BACL
MYPFVPIRKRKYGLKRFVLLLLMMLLVLSGCGARYASPMMATSDAPYRIQSVIDEKAFFDRSRDEGQLAIRYFHLTDREKSGDAILIESPDGEKMLIDAGYVPTGKKLDQYLNRLDVSKLDVAVATHPHHDHIGGYLELLQTQEIGQLLMPDLSNRTSTYQKFMKLVEKNDIEVHYAEEGTNFMLGSSVQIEVLNPPKGTTGKWAGSLNTAQMNNRCLVMKLTYGDRTFLFTCDIYRQAEHALTAKYTDQLNVDVLHAPHHGDNTSSSIPFIYTVQPKVTLISSHERYSSRVYSSYEEAGSRVFMTGEHGNLLILTDGYDIQIVSQQDPD